MKRGLDRLGKRINDLEALDVSTIREQGQPEIIALGNAIDEALTLAFGHNTIEYNRYAAARNLDHGANYAKFAREMAGHGSAQQDLSEARQLFSKGKQRALVLLKQAVASLAEDISDRENQAPVGDRRESLKAIARKVFVVHGHDESALLLIARFLEQLGLEAVILREQPDQGRTIIEKFEDCGNEVGFAVVLLTPDDVARAGARSQEGTRARQNVIFELGYFAGKLGRGRACLLRRGDVEIPSDLYGVIYTELDAAEGWKLKLVKELKAARLDFDANRMWG